LICKCKLIKEVLFLLHSILPVVEECDPAWAGQAQRKPHSSTVAGCKKILKLPFRGWGYYTLYYYDQAGNLVKTVPPQGVKPERGATFLSSVATARANGTVVTPGHELPTVYRYNSLNGVVTQKTPDAGLSKFWYDRLGRMAISQNAKQAANSKYSYTIYDYLGRPTEVAEKLQYTTMTNTISRNAGSLQGWIRFGNKESLFRPKFVTLTVYDELSQGTPWWQCGSFADRFAQKAWTLRNRVSFMRYDEDLEYNYYINNGDTVYTPVMDGYITGIDYSYDIHGNVDRMANIYWYGTMMQYYGCNNNKVIEYKYDLISGKVNEVHFNPGENDEFYHRYYYDAENRITDVYTTDNKMFVGNEDLEEHDAHYEYYKHGPLARTVLGQQQVQGIDYAYTLQGWLKGVNSTSLNADHDMGLDGKLSGNNWYIGRDAYGFNLNYFTGEYKSINTSVNPFPGHSAYLGSAYRPLYNGNISSMAVNIGKFNQPQLYNYEYDQLNRIVGMDVYRGLDQTNNNWNSLAIVNDYKERVQYDANGKILKYLRQGHGSNLTMDSLSYSYYSGTNRLSHIRDQVNGSTSHNGNYTEDLNDQGTNNYTYDEIGNLKTDASENIQHIEWTPYGKIHEISKLSSPLIHSIYVKYFYDPAGNRIGKTEEYAQDDAHFNWYVKDAQGNIMATYQVTGGWAGEGPLLLKEHHLYGSSRIGIIKRDWDMQDDKYLDTNANLIGPTYLVNLSRGRKFFDLSNHLGNVLATITDKKEGKESGTPDGIVDYYNADVASAQDYYPFGFVMPNRKYSINGKLPTFTFNGKMNDGEVKGDGLQHDYGFRVYDPRCGCFLSVDPLTKEYPFYTPYQFAGNKPIMAVDLDGLEEKIVINDYKDGKLIATQTSYYKDVKDKIPSLPVELKVIPNMGTVTMERQRFSGLGILGQNDYNYFLYRPDQNSYEMTSAKVYTNKFLQWTAEKSKWINDNINTAGYGNELSYTTKLDGMQQPINGELKLTNSSEAYQNQTGTIKGNNNLSVTGSANANSSVDPHKSKPSLSGVPENYSYFFFSNKTDDAKSGEQSNEQTTSYKILGLKIEWTKSQSGTIKLKIGVTTKPGVEVKTSLNKQKTILQSNTGSIKY
jgi:RHS repeat-associated protein